MRKYWPVLLVFLGALVFAANFHIFTGSRGVHVVPRVTLSLSEFFVNEDALRGMPALMLATQFPLSAMALKADDAREIEAARKIVEQ